MLTVNAHSAGGRGQDEGSKIGIQRTGLFKENVGCGGEWPMDSG